MLAIDGMGGVQLPFFGQMKPDEIAADLEHARSSGLTAALHDMGPFGKFWLTDAAFEAVKQRIADSRAAIAAHPETLLLVEKTADLERAHREKRFGVIFTFQGTEPLGEDLDRITLFRGLGLRVMQLTHNRRNLVADGCMEPSDAGLSRYGHEVVERLNAKKIVVDLSHAGRRAIREGIAASKAPVLIGHAGCRALADLPRNVDDTELRAMANRGGAIGIIFWPYLRTDTQPMAIDVIRHIEHAIRVCGEDHVGIGTDGGVSPIERTPEFEEQNRQWVAEAIEGGIFAKGRSPDLYMFIPDLNVANRFEVLGAMLSARGHSDARIAKLLGGNFARVMADVWDRS